MGFFSNKTESTGSTTPVATTRPETEIRENSRDGITFWSESTSSTPTASDAKTKVDKK
jgi:hypothetical protein